MSVIDTFDQIVNVYGTREAVVLESGHSISYTNLNDAAGDLAMVIVSHISTSEIEDENMLVGIMVQRHIGLIVSILGVLKSGAAYVPVDPSFPPDRQSYIFTHSKSKLLIADEHAWSQAIHLGISLPPVIIINENGVVIRSHLQHAYMKRHISIARLMEESRQRALHQIDGGLMYVLYTSGSTGKPKGVMVTNLSVANVVDYFAIELKVSPDSRVLCLTTVCFDISVIEIFMPLTRGAALVLIKSETQRDPFRILEVVREQQVSVVQATPTTFEMLLATGWSGDASVDFLVGGEEFRSSLHQITRNCRTLRNAYGPTETTIYSTSHLLSNSEVVSEFNRVPIGKPLSKAYLYLLDLEQAAAGILHLAESEGELMIGGVGLSRGYLHDVELTQQRFIPNPFGEGLLYRSGDLVRRLESGEYVFVSRLDDQVKVNGYRIELGEVEGAYAAHPEVMTAVVALRESSLVLYLQLTQAIQIPLDARLDAIHSFVARSLPSYMMPRNTLVVDSFPMTISSKIDRSALPMPNYQEHDGNYPEIEGDLCPLGVSVVEEQIAEIVQRITNRRMMSHSSFAAIGVDSLSAALLVRALSSKFPSVGLDSTWMYAPHTTLRSLSKRVNSKLSSCNEDSSNDDMDVADPSVKSFEAYFQGLISINLKLLQGLRGFLAFMVLYEHNRPPGINFSHAWLSDASLFVIMSGFSLTLQLTGVTEWTYISNNKGHRLQLVDTFSLRQFLSSRALGLFPILWLTLVIVSPRWYLQNNPFVLDPTPHEFVHDLAPPLTPQLVATCAFLYTIGMDSHLRPGCLASGPKDVYFGGVLWNLYLIYAITRVIFYRIMPFCLNYVTIPEWAVDFLMCRPHITMAAISQFTSLHLVLTSILIALGSLGGGNFTSYTFLPYFLAGISAAALFQGWAWYLFKKNELCHQVTIAPSVHLMPISLGALEPRSSANSDQLSLWSRVGECLRSLWRASVAAVSLPDLLACLILLFLSPLKLWNDHVIGSLGWFLHWYGMPICFYALLVAGSVEIRPTVSRIICEYPILGILGYSSYAIYLLQDVMLNFYVHLAKDDISSMSFPWPTDKNLTIAYDFYYQSDRWFSNQPLIEKIIIVILLIFICWGIQKFYQDTFILHVASTLLSQDKSKHDYHREENMMPIVIDASNYYVPLLRANDDNDGV